MGERNLKSKGHNANSGGKITSILLLAAVVLGSRSLTFVVKVSCYPQYHTIGIGMLLLLLLGCICFWTAFTVVILVALAAITTLFTLSSTLVTSYAFFASRCAS